MSSSATRWPATLLILVSALSPIATAGWRIHPAAIEAAHRAALPDTLDWAADVDLLLRAIRETFPDPYRLYDSLEWERAAGELKRRLPRLSAAQASLEFHRLLAMAGDGHTEPARLHASLRGPWLPIIFRRFADGWFVRTADPAYRALFGRRIVALGGVPIEDAVRRARPYVSSDNAIGRLDPVSNFLRNVAILEALGLAASGGGARGGGLAGAYAPVPVTVVEPTGQESTISVWPTDDAWVTPEWRDVDDVLNPGALPLYRQLDGNYAFEWLPEEGILYVAFSEVRDDEELDETISEFFARVFAFVRDHDVERFVLDLRENSGGNLDLNGPVIHGLVAAEKVNRPGHLFVVIGRDTYSAAMHLAVSLERHTYASFVGEPTGSRPNHFGDTREVTLPASGMVVEISELYWQQSDPRDDRPWITPDLPAALRFSDFLAHRDPALEAIRRFEAADSLAEGFGSPMLRWQRANQLREEVWPPLVP